MSEKDGRSASGRSTRKQAHAKRPRTSDVVSITALIVLGVVSVADLLLPGNIPTIVYWGFIGASLGAKWDGLQSFLGSDKK